MSIWSRLRERLSRLGASLDAILHSGEVRPQSVGGDKSTVEEDSSEGGAFDGGIAFTIGIVAMAAKMAYADGEVSEAEADVIRRLFQVPEPERKNVTRFFALAGRSLAGFDSYARGVARIFRDRPGVLEDVLDALFAIACADGRLHPRELEFLTQAAEIFGFSENEFARIHAIHTGAPDPYRVLGLEPDCDDEELTRTYRRLVRENHPDSLIGRGVPAEFVAMASAKLAAINHAHDEIVRRRKAS